METPEQRIQIAVQKTGRLTDHSIDLLERCGLKLTRSKDQLICYGENMPIDLLLVRDELAGWLANMGQEDYQGDRAFFLECFEGNNGAVIPEVPGWGAPG